MYLHYRTLFSLRVLLDYYLTEEAGLYQASMSNVLDTQYRKYRLERDLRIVPTAECGQLFRDQKLLFKRNNMGGVVACQARPLPGGFFTPFIPLDAPLRLRFAVFPENPAFYNFTNIPLEKNGTGKDSFLYYFSNRSNNAVNSQLYLSRPVAPFDPAYAYKAGEILLNNSNPLSPVMQEALEDNGPGAQNLSQWREIFAGQNPHFQFVTTNDRVVVRPSAFKYRVESAAQEHLLVAVRNPNGVIVKTLAFHTDLPGAPLFECELKLNDLNPGLYRLEVQDTTGTVFPNLSLVFYLDDALYQQRPLAVIECFHEPSGSLSDYRWLDPANDDRMLEPEYTLRWKNRSTWWRYYYETAPGFTSTDVGNLDPNPANPNHRILISSEPLALTQIGREVELTLTSGDLVLLPNPGVDLIYPEQGRVFSEINSGGGLGPPA